MADATWLAPPYDGVTLWHLTDTHLDLTGLTGQWSKYRLNDVAMDLRDSATTAKVDARIHTGDITDDSSNDETSYMKDWLNLWMGGPSDVWVVGNHDYGNGFSGQLKDRYDFEAEYNRSILSNNLVTGADGSQIRLIGFGPNEWTPTSDTRGIWTIPEATIDWITNILTSDPNTPTFLGCHFPLHELSDNYSALHQTQPASTFDQIISDYPQVAGWISGHYHFGTGDDRMAKTVPVGNRSAFPILCGPSPTFTAGIDRGKCSAYPYRSLFMTYRGADRIEVRYRDHGSRRWATAPNGDPYTVLNPS